MKNLNKEQQARAIKLLKQGLALKDESDAGNGISGEEDDNHTHDMRMLLIDVGAIADRRKVKK